jgi:hypothetical protein
MLDIASVAWLVEMKGSKHPGEDLTLAYEDLSQTYYLDGIIDVFID